MDDLMAALGDVRIMFWTCPVREHGRRQLSSHAGGREVQVVDLVSGFRLAPITVDAIDCDQIATLAY